MTSRTRAVTANRKTIKAPISQKTLKKLTKLLLFIAKQEQVIELQRQFLASNDIMEPYSLFQRMDRDEDGFVTSMKILNFLRDNGINHVTEADCYYLVKFFDADEDGKLNYPDFMQMVLPCDNPHLRAVATQRPNQFINKFDYLTLDVERDLTKLLLSEVEMHKQTETLKQELESMQDFTQDGLYSAVDDWNYGYIDLKNLNNFFKRQKQLPTDDQCVAIIRRLDLDADSKLKREEFMDGIKPQEPYSKMIVRERLTKKDERFRIKKQNKSDLAKGKRVDKRAEEGVIEDTVRVQAIDRSYRDVLSTSPLKHRPNLDLYGTPSKLYSPSARREDPHVSQCYSISKSRSPNQITKFFQNNESMTQFLSPQQAQRQIAGRNGKLGSTSKTFNHSHGLGDEQTTIASPSKFRMSGATNLAHSTYKTPSKFTSQQKRGKKQPIDSVFDMSAPGNDEGNLTTSQLRQSNTSDRMIESHMVNIFRDQLNLERALEKAKVDLSLRTDFNLIDAFRVFDSEGRGWISASELKEGLKQLDILASIEDMQLFMIRYDKNEEGRLRYGSFCDAFLPIDAFHASLLAKKAPLQVYNVQQQKSKMFYPQTMELFVSAWKTHLTNEIEAQKIRLSLSCKAGFNTYQYFQCCDSKNDGIIDKDEIKDLLVKHSLYVCEKEICALIDRYDRTRDGKISYSEFVEELTPK